MLLRLEKKPLFYDDLLRSFFDINHCDLELKNTSCDIYEDTSNVCYEINVPGFTKRDLEIKIENDSLIVEGKTKQAKEKDKDNKTYILSERSFKSFKRQFSLPKSVDIDKISADHKNGVLSIIIPKSLKSKTKEVEIS